MGRPQLYNSSEEKARAARKYRQAYKESNAKSINQQLFTVIRNSSRDFAETLCCALIQCEQSEVTNGLINILAALDIIEDLELEARKDIIAWVRIDMDALDEAYEKGEIYHQYANSICMIDLILHSLSAQKLLSLSGSRIRALRLPFNGSAMDHPLSARSSCCVPPFIKQSKKNLKRVKRDANIVTQIQLTYKDTETEVQEIQRALAVAFGYDEDLSEPETSDDKNDALSLDLPSCLLAFKNIKDEMLVLIGEPCAFTESLLLQYIKSFPDEMHGEGDTSIIQNAKTEVEHLLRRATRVQDQIVIICGVSTESCATESVSWFLSTTLAYIDDVQYYLDIEGITELTVAHSMGDLMYQKGIRI
ncbi:hypothetical protein DEU56DRAFT_907324 [Suillus clintonianus]|uniref:uncharacterized protein n=1 Tax=Suillus clintonianus TaxID=1904413 RepID=UPI001B85D2C1|nr:uncharacterized protein DEU56DRAFT_907324 [Suillus clintonianus]KAG2153845.1 hypothetical protein DEU56DRAFT_907324 [Suillus clintonianus]